MPAVTLRVYQQITQNVVLNIGAEKQTVTVEATPPLVDTTNASLGTVVGQAAILNMPLNLREVGALALLVPGTVDTTGISLATGPANGSGFNDIGYSGSGGGSGGNVLLIDGMISRALNNSSFALDPPPEMVSEFKIQNNVYDASFGLASGTTMNLITNSGTEPDSRVCMGIRQKQRAGRYWLFCTDAAGTLSESIWRCSRRANHQG